ncbi:hypothetical protein E8E13_007890 [Curvularia kusanoi]|uniref:GEgh 16 protein n=1 Tax=Curvularia kusanoi TaxID=90978 RepID=A0A9P4TNH3_CURKU|nr:hypothetical protein E8E13_007890 [Curvularia kusanoi]
MYYSAATIALVAFAANVQAHGAILAAVGDSGKSQGFLVDQTLARNCTTISPCQQDSTIIRDAEITQNIVNSCGRTEINGNIDVGEQTENELAAKRVTQVSKGTVMQVTIHQVNADGAGPYECDLDETSNAATKFTPLKVANNVPGSNGLSQAKEQDFTISVAMPDNFNCIGASTGNICTVRCRNTAVAGPFGGCFAVQQTDGQGRKDTTAKGVTTAQTLQGVSAQILQNQKDLPVAIAANQAAGAAGGNEGASAISALISATAGAPAATQTAAAGNGQNQNAGGNRGGNQAGNGAGNAAAGNGAAGNGAAGNQGGNRNGAGNAANGGNRAGQNQGNANAGNGQAGRGGNAAGRQGNQKRSNSGFFKRFL